MTAEVVIPDNIDVSMPSRASTSLLRKFIPCRISRRAISVNALTGFNLIATEYPGWPNDQYDKLVSMPSRASTSLLQYPFKKLGFMRVSEPIFAGICQNILAIAVFRACS